MKVFLNLFAEALEMEPDSVNKNDRFREYEEWDSLVVLSVIAMIKKNYEITIPRKEFDALLTVNDLHNYIKQHSE